MKKMRLDFEVAIEVKNEDTMAVTSAEATVVARVLLVAPVAQATVTVIVATMVEEGGTEDLTQTEIETETATEIEIETETDIESIQGGGAVQAVVTVQAETHTTVTHTTGTTEILGTEEIGVDPAAEKDTDINWLCNSYIEYNGNECARHTVSQFLQLTGQF